MTAPMIVDAHEDIAWNKTQLGRDLLESTIDKRRREGDSPAHGQGTATLGLAELLAGNVRLVFATLYASPHRSDRPAWYKMYRTPDEAYVQAMEQLAYYALLAGDPRVSIITSRGDLERLVGAAHPQLGLVLLMEGADPILEPAQVQEWFDSGVRIVGPSWHKTRYAGGTGEPGGLSSLGRELMVQMERVGLLLDTSHMAEQSFFEALELYHGPIIASHSNCRVFVNTDRQLSDAMIRAIVGREGVIGTVLYNRFLRADWDQSAKKETVNLEDVVRQIRHICDLAGDARHVGIGSDLDGGFGKESAPREIDTVADLQRLADALAPVFGDEDVLSVLGGNWIRVLRRALPE